MKNRNVEYYRVGKLIFYMFDYSSGNLVKYRFKPSNKRVRLRIRTIYFSSRFYLLNSIPIPKVSPKKYFKYFGIEHYKIIKVGDYL